MYLVLLICVYCFCFFFFFKQKTAYEMRISDWSSDVCSSDLPNGTIGWGRQELKVLVDNNDPAKQPSYAERIAAHFYSRSLLPERDRGLVAVGFQPNNYTDNSTQSWQYQDRKSTRLNSSH